jgi:hypothetical protein
VMGLTIKDIAEDSFNAKFFNYIMFHKLELSDEAKSHLSDILMPKGKPTVNVQEKESSEKVFARILKTDSKPGDMGNDELSVYIGYNNGDALKAFFYGDQLGPAHEAKLAKMSDDILRELAKATKGSETLGKKVYGNVGTYMTYMKQYGSAALVSAYQKQIRGKIAADYKAQSGMDAVKKINAIKDPRAKEDAIEKYAKEVKRAIENIIAVG